MKRKVISVISVVFVIFFCFGFGEGFAQSSPKRGGTLTVGFNSDIAATDPHVTANFLTSIVMRHMFETLVTYGEKLEFVPMLAERWEITPDYKTYTFYLRKGKLFHNGREMVADDVKYSIERIKDPKTGNPVRSFFNNLDQVEVVDKYTVRFRMKVGDATLLSSLAYIPAVMAIVPREEVEKQGGVMKAPVGTGPFKFAEWKPDRYLLLERFDRYKPQPGPPNGFGGGFTVYVDKLKIVPLPEESVSVMALMNKEVDFLLNIPFKDIEKFKTDYTKRGMVIDEAPGLTWYSIVFRCDRPIMRDVKFRRACAYAIDLDLIAKTTTRGFGEANPSAVAAANYYHTPAHKKWYKKDVERAKQLLKESEYRGEEITLYTTKAYPMNYAQAVVVQSELAAAGIKVKLEVLDWVLLSNRYNKGDFDLISFSNSARPDPTVAYQDVIRSSSFQNARLTQVVDESAKTLDFEKRKKLFEEAHEVVYQEVPVMVTFNYNYSNSYWSYLKGYKNWSTSTPRFWGVWLEK
jgi:peptide/nickel transport system substrate-binding protein